MHLSIQNISKHFQEKIALNNVSFEIEHNKIYGLLGQNGAGKTTLIRIVTQILLQDSGIVQINGTPIQRKDINLIGYMPEERGMYKKMKVTEHLLYLLQLRGFSKQQAITKINYYLEKLAITSWADKELADLSKGMQQKVQFIATILHEPQLLILDEPFSGLDPINSDIIKQEIFELHQKGATIIFSTHRMENVEEICSDIILLHQGKKILEGNVANIKQQFKANNFEINFTNSVATEHIPSNYTIVDQQQNKIVVHLIENQTISDLLLHFLQQKNQIVGVKEILPSIHEIFVQQVNTIH